MSLRHEQLKALILTSSIKRVVRVEDFEAAKTFLMMMWVAFPVNIKWENERVVPVVLAPGEKIDWHNHAEKHTVIYYPEYCGTRMIIEGGREVTPMEDLCIYIPPGKEHMVEEHNPLVYSTYRYSLAMQRW